MVVAPVSNTARTTTTTTTDAATESMMDSARVGLDYIVENGDYVEKLASALESKNFVVKKQVFELLSALSVYSNDGYGRTLQALDYFKNHRGERYRFKFIVQELRSSPTVEYQTAVLAFINCLILATPDLRERIRVRSEFIGLKLLQALSDLRLRNKDYADLLVQLDVFDEQKESDESQVSPNSNGIDLSSPLEVFDAILRQIADSPQEVPFLCILQHLLRIESKEPISDLIWDAAERLVHRATLVETRDDALRLLKAPSHAKSLHKLKGPNNNGDKCNNCGCHKGERPPDPPGGLPATVTQSTPPPAPPPPPPPMGSTPPPPPPPTGGMKNDLKKDLPKLPQQSTPVPKAKMRTVNWNKIPSGQVLSGDKNNLWATIAKKQNSKAALDWTTLEGLFCLQNEQKLGNGTGNNFGGLRISPVEGEGEKRNVRRETSEVTLLDAKRSLNINIFLKQFRSSYEEMIELILRGSSEEFGLERLRGLLKILPSSDEIEMLTEVAEKDKPRLASAEKFLLQFIKLPGYKLRIEAMLLKEELETCVSIIESSITAILQAAQDVKTSEEFQEVIFMILVAGNFLNSGGYAGDAAGVKLTSLQKITDIRGNKPGVSLLHFISMQAEARNPRLISFVNDMTALEEASKTSGEQLQGEIHSLKSKVTNISQQLRNPLTPKDVINQFDHFFKEATHQITSLESYLVQVEKVKEDLAQFFCEDLQTFKLEDCFKILYAFTTKWKLAAQENGKRKKQELEAENRRKAREEQVKKRSQVGWGNQNQLSAPSPDDPCYDRTRGVALNPEDDIFIACSPRIVRRRLGSFSDNNGNGGQQPPGPDQLTLPSPDITPNGSLRRRRSRIPSEEDESGLMDFLRSSGSSSEGIRERRGTEQYGSLDRSWSRKTRRRPNLMDFVNDERERPVSPAPPHLEHKGPGGSIRTDTAESKTGVEQKPDGERKSKNESPVREWRERISAWFVDLENGGSGEIPKRRPPPPQRFQRRLGVEARGESVSRGLATLPEGEADPEEESPHVTTYQRVYPDRKPSLTVNTDVVSAMEAIEKVQSPVKERRRPSFTSPFLNEKESPPQYPESGRRSLIESLGNQTKDEKLTLYIPEKAIGTRKLLRRSPSMKEEGVKDGSDEIYGEAGTKEGFDRFSSIRRSRRYKKGPESPTMKKDAPAFPRSIPQMKFVSKVDITGDSNPGHASNGVEAKVVCTGGSEFKPRQNPFSRTRARNDPRSASMIDSRHVHLALGRKSSNEQDPSTVSGQNVTSGARPIFAIPSGGREVGPPSKTILSSSPGSTERDEGFEESQSSLSETNSQSEATLISGSGLFRASNNNKGRGQFRLDVPPTVTSDSSRAAERKFGVLPLIRKKSTQENSPTESHATNSSRTSLQGSRSSLTSQSTVNTVREVPDGGKSKEPTTPTKGLEQNPLAAPFRKPLNANNNRTPLFQGTKNGKNEGLSNGSHFIPTAKPGVEKEKNGSKSLTPRILSFMRPTASSSAKDKIEPPKPKGLLHRKSFK